MKVVLTAPSPTSSTPSFPFAGAMSAPFSIGMIMLGSLSECGVMILRARFTVLLNLAQYCRWIAQSVGSESFQTSFVDRLQVG